MACDLHGVWVVVEGASKSEQVRPTEQVAILLVCVLTAGVVNLIFRWLLVISVVILNFAIVGQNVVCMHLASIK